MNKKKAIKIVLLLAFSFLLFGCWGVDGEFKHMRNEIFDEMNYKDFDRELEYSVSGFEILLASKLAKISDRTFDLEILLDKISNAQIGIYNLNENEKITLNSFTSFEERIRQRNWVKLVKSCDGEELCFVYVNMKNPDRIKDILVLSVENEQMVIVQVHGRLEELVEQLIKKRGIKV
ncbi:MAG: DUF4252 domain-containing protein [Ignavibacteriales bacterium]|nr:DUF4252 domain-containing protein [Ignavibacteriales bacterium]